MRIIRVVHILEASQGGTGKHVMDLVDGLNKNKYEVILIYSANRADSIFLSRLKELARHRVQLLEIAMGRGWSPVLDVKSLIDLVRYLNGIKPDLLHLHGAKAGLLGRIAGLLCGIRHIIYNPHGGAFHKFEKFPGMLYRFVEHILVGKTTSYIGVSRFACVQIKQSLAIDDNRIRLIYNGIDLLDIDTQKQTACLTRRDLDLDTETFVVLYPALFLESKGHMEFIRAIRTSKSTLNDTIVIILAGEGALRGQIQKEINASGLGDRIRIIGFHEKIGDLYNIADMVILPSQSEVFGYVVLEAMAHAKPVLVTSVGSLVEIVEHGYNGELIGIEQLPRFIDRLNYYSLNRSQAMQLGLNGRKYVEDFYTTSAMVGETMRLYEDVLDLPDLLLET